MWNLSRARRFGPPGLMLLATLALAPLLTIELHDTLPPALLVLVLVLAAGSATLLGGYAVRQPGHAGGAIGVALVALATYAVIASQLERVPAWVGPSVSLGLLALGVPMVFLGRSRPLVASWLLLLAGLLAPLDRLLFAVIHDGFAPDAGGLALAGTAGWVTIALLATSGLTLLLHRFVPGAQQGPEVESLRPITL
jgi:hypothetical protein